MRARVISNDCCGMVKGLSSCQRLQVQALGRRIVFVLSAASEGVYKVPMCCLWVAYRVLCMHQVVCCHEGFLWAPLAVGQVQHVGNPSSGPQGHLNSHNHKGNQVGGALRMSAGLWDETSNRGL